MTIFRLNFLLKVGQMKVCQNPSFISTGNCGFQKAYVSIFHDLFTPVVDFIFTNHLFLSCLLGYLRSCFWGVEMKTKENEVIGTPSFRGVTLCTIEPFYGA